MFASLVTSYTEAYQNGHMPSVESALKSLSRIENTKAADVALIAYVEEMKTLKLPTKDEETFDHHHIKSKEYAVQLFLRKAVMDTNNEFQAGLKVTSILQCIFIKGLFCYFIKGGTSQFFR